MVEVWQFWEFEHFSNNIVRVIDAPSGLELFAVDVFQIIAPALNDGKVILIDAKTNQRQVMINQKIVVVNTLNALGIHSLTGIVKADVVRQFMQWVRSQIVPIFRKQTNLNIENNIKHITSGIIFPKRDSLINYLYSKGQKIWEVEIEVIELYLKLIYNKIPLAANCPGTSNYQELSFRQQYLELVKLVLSEIINYEELYSTLVALAPNLLIAQELDFYIYKSLKLNSNYELMKIIEQGLILQTFKSITDNLAEFSKQRYLEIFYFQILECFSGD
ncbi:hypothetical protein [Nostoc sp.]